MRDVLLVGGAPRVRIDAVRYLTVAASGNTATALHEYLHAKQCASTLLLGTDANPSVLARRFNDRYELEKSLRNWIDFHPTGVIVLSAAINDYQLKETTYQIGKKNIHLARGDKMPSGASEVTVKLEPATKVIDQLRAWGHKGPLVGFKYQDKNTVIKAATALRERVGADYVVANSLCGSVQALLSDEEVQYFDDRADLMGALCAAVLSLASK